MQAGGKSEETVGDLLHAELVEAFGLETEAWATDRLRRVGERLQADVPAAARFHGEILWMQSMTAFTGPGRYVYFSRELIQRLPSDDAVAFVFAHEMAHHELGHLRGMNNCFRTVSHLPGFLVAVALHRLQHGVFGPEREDDADDRALDHSLAVGYSGDGGIEVFDALEMYALDHRDLDIVFGPDGASEGIRRWFWERCRGYRPLRERRERLIERLSVSRP